MLVTVLALFGKFREMFVINYLRWQTRTKKTPFPSDPELMGLTKINNIYALKEAKEVSVQWQNSKVFAILGLLREYDAKSKGVNAGGATEGELLRELLLKIFMM